MAARTTDLSGRGGTLLRFVYYWVPVIILCAFIFSTSSFPGKDIPSLFSHQDILYHFAVYVILALFFIRALKNTGDRRTVLRLVFLTLVFGVAYAASDELHQLFTSGRSCDIFDLLTDSLGTLAGASAGGVYIKWRS
ncbi:MAG: VanZ family protein [Deltaproteobacteria bacterium]